MDASMTHASSVRMTRRASAFAALLILAAGLSGCSKLKARDLLNKGVAAFKNGLYDTAVEDFKQAKDLDPALIVARLYLATAYDPKKFEESKSYHQKHIEQKSTDPEPYYWIGVIDWTLSFRANGELRAAYNRDHITKQVKDTDPLPAALRSDYTAKFGSLVEEGITDLQKAIQLRPDYDDAMAYLNLLYRRKADMVESADERAALLKQADDLVDKVKEIKQKRSEQPQQPS